MSTRVSAGIELAFDPDTEDRIRQLWYRLEDAEVTTLASHTHRQHRPHLSVVVADWLDLDEVRDALASVVCPLPLPVTFESAGLFPSGVLWLGVVVTHALLDLNLAVHRALDQAGIVGWPYYRPGHWTPHCTLAPHVAADVVESASRLALGALPFTGWIVASDIVRHTTELAEYHPLWHNVRSSPDDGHQLPRD